MACDSNGDKKMNCSVLDYKAKGFISCPSICVNTSATRRALRRSILPSSLYLIWYTHFDQMTLV